MLQIPGPLCGDKRADKIITAYVNDRLIGLVSEISEDEALYLFPENYDDKKAREKFLKLSQLLKAEEEYAPEQVMEYVLAQLLAAYEQLGEDEQPPMPDRAYVMSMLEKDFAEDGSANPSQEAVEYLEQLENPAEYQELIFWDMDFALLEEYQEEDLARNNPEFSRNALSGER